MLGKGYSGPRDVVGSAPVSASRAPALLALIVALLSGAAPWRVCAHAEGGHALILLPGSGHLQQHAHGRAPKPAACRCARVLGPRAAGFRDDCRLPARSQPGHAPQSQDGDRPPAPAEAPSEGHCHCEDAPLVTGAVLAPVTLAAPVFAGFLWVSAPRTAGCASRAIDPGVPEGLRVACEEDPIVLLR